MNFESTKAENCFADAENYEYKIPITAAEIIEELKTMGAEIRINDKLRRPAFIGKLADGTRIKGTLAKNVLKVGYTPNNANTQRENFENWMRTFDS